jgi:hypothetical protein
MGVLEDGLCVMNVSGDLHGAAPVLRAETWRIVRQSYNAVPSPLYFYWESELADPIDFWVYSDNSGNWVFAQKNNDYKRTPDGTVPLYPTGDGSSWDCDFHDHAEVLIIILPPGIGVAETSPPAQATIKRDRLMLFFMRPAIDDHRQINWIATAKLYKVRDTSELTRIVGDLNRTHNKDHQARAAASISQVQPRDQVPPPGPDRSLQDHQPKIFLCYRREDTQGFARGIYETLTGQYGREQVFRDIDSTPAGVRFATWIESILEQCSVMIVLIGAAWSSVRDRAGQRRLDLPEDWVRQEIEVALRREIPIIPVRVQAAPMPPEEELPPSIADLAGFQSAEVTDSRWNFDMSALMQHIDNLIASD